MNSNQTAVSKLCVCVWERECVWVCVCESVCVCTSCQVTVRCCFICWSLIF